MSLLKKIIAEVNKVDEVDEVVALLRNSQLPTLVVENYADVRIYSRWIEQHLFGTYRIDVLAANGKGNLLSLYDRKNEFAGLPIVFVANRGIWLFSGIPEDYEDIIWTQGYSVENDVYSMGEIENLLDPTRAWEHWLVQESIIRWFAFELEALIPQTLSESNLSLGNLIPKYNFEIEEFIAGLNLGDLIPKDNTKLDKSFRKNRGFCWPRTEIIEEVSTEYRFDLPGKLLFQMLDRFSSTPLHVLYNTALTNYKSKRQGLILGIKEKFDEQRSTSSQEILPKLKTQNPISSVQQARDSDEGLLSKILPSQVDFVEESDFLVDKLVIELKNTGLPTIIVEGKDNINIIERLVEHHRVREFLDAKEVKVVSIPKRARLLSVYDRRSEFVHILPVAFVADLEMGVFSGIPERYADIIWTQGYSLKNDLYANAYLETLLEPHEVWRHQQVLNSTIKWFAFEVEEFLRGNPVKTDFKLSKIVRQGELELDKGFCQHRGFRQPSPELTQHIKNKHQSLLPGNFLFQVLARFLSMRGRDFNFNISERSLYNIALEMHDSQLQSRLDGLMKKIRDKLGNEEKRIAETKFTVSQRRKASSRKEHRTESRRTTKQQHKSKSKQNQMWKSRNTQSSRPSQSLRKPNVKLGDKISAVILKKDSIKVTAQLQTGHEEEIAFEYPYYPGKVGDKVKLKVTDIDGTGRVRKVIP